MCSSNMGENERARVLIVDDEALVALYISDVIEEAGDVEIKTAATAEEAMAAAEHWSPDVAIVDVSLGNNSSGTDVAARLAAHHSAIIFLSGHSDLLADKAIRDLNPVAVLSKPCLPAELEKALRSALAARKR